ncbi:hypothetical protein KH5H1_05720 [Corallococcus caeni]|uniref:Uncharacterized protein n=1 Tax=Corallococcus caeni TaxID=3082388 RepID=A0ABQ6QWA8_9BACT|nr:hypothetical protein KH5H1_05720 [Corallococcus sp. KH5-1]GMU08291.1 hypothetical protein ASNO1_45440 [Corallococcus sp. NO1]
MNDTLDRWIQRATLMGLLALAATLATVGATLYAHRDPPAATRPGTPP